MINKMTMQVSCFGLAWRGIRSCWILVLVALTFAGDLHADLIAQNEAVPSTMTATGGTPSNPSVYVFDNYAKDFGSSSIAIGTAVGASWIRLEIRNGATVTTTGAANRLGSDSGSYTNAFNSVLVTGAGSSLTMGTSRMGGMSPNNSLIINDGATVTLNGDLTNGFNPTPVATNNTIVVDNAMLAIGSTRMRIGYGDGHNYNTLVVRNGGSLISTTGRIGIRYGKYCDILVEGAGSLIELGFASANALLLGESATYCHHNTLTIVDGGVVKLTQSGGTLGITVDANEGGSGVRFAAGIFAVMGNRPTHVPANRAWLWNGESWDAAPVDWVGTYFADESEASAGGHPGFGGYTVFTGGKSMVGALNRTLIVVR